MIASDSYNLKPRTFDTIVLNAGERFDLIVETIHESGDFWIRVRGLGICFPHKIESFALLRYTAEEDDDQSSENNANSSEEQILFDASQEEDDSDDSEEYEFPIMPNFNDEFPRNAVRIIIYLFSFPIEVFNLCIFFPLPGAQSSECHLSKYK